MADSMSSLTDKLIDKIMLSQPLLAPQTKTLALQGVVDYFAASLQARQHDETKKLLDWITLEGGNTQAWLIGQYDYGTARQAAIFNGFQAHLLDYDDVHADVRGHPSAVILSALLASLDSDEISSQRFLSAYIVGIELMAHLGQAIGQTHYQKGWHNTATLGGIATTAAICYLHQYSFIKDALAIAATQASGLRLLFGTSIKPLQAGMAAQVAIQSCQWAKVGLKAECDFLDDKKGFLAVYGQGNLALNIDSFGKPWRIVSPGLWFKNYPYCSAASYVADATQLLIKQHHFASNDIKNIEIIFSSQSDEALIYRQVDCHAQGRFSAEYIVASILLKRRLTFDTFSDQPVDDDLKQLMQKVTRHYDNDATKRYAQVDIQLNNSQRLTQAITAPKGSPNNPYSHHELTSKFINAVGDETLAQQGYQMLLKLNEDISVNALIKQLSELLRWS